MASLCVDPRFCKSVRVYEPINPHCASMSRNSIGQWGLRIPGGLPLLQKRHLHIRQRFPSINKPIKAATSSVESSLMKMTKKELVDLILELKHEKELLEEELSLYNPKVTVIKEQNAPARLSEDDEIGDGMSGVSQSNTNLDFDSKESLLSALRDGIVWPDADKGFEFWTQNPRKEGILALSESLQDLGVTQIENNSPSERKMHIVHVTAEMAPLAKVGGLGDVVTGLGLASLRKGHTVEAILPFYECIDISQVEDLRLERTFDCPTGHDNNDDSGHIDMSFIRFEAWSGRIEGCPVIMLKPLDVPFFKGGAIYGGSYNETQAYLIFCRAALEYMAQSGMQPNIIHTHEWQGAAVSMLFWELYSSQMPSTRPILTIHNMDNSGECRQDEFAATGVSGTLFASVDKALDERTIGHNPERLCLLKGGVIYSSAVTTVSPTYAQETLIGGSAGFLQSTLAKPEVAAKYMGILNGIDTNIWNPATDPYLPACFSSHVPEGKALCKAYLQRGLGLEESPDKPLVAVISRLVPQKGIHLIEHAAIKTVDLGGQFVLLGTGHASGGLQSLANDRFREDKNMSMMFMYSEPLSHLMYAAADIFLVPSMFEPCGLTQMIALRYGGVPLVRKTGGLADTVRDVEQIPTAQGEFDSPIGVSSKGNGFVFDGVDAHSVEQTLVRAFDLYRQSPDEWKDLSIRNMRDSFMFSWDSSLSSYEQLYVGLSP